MCPSFRRDARRARQARCGPGPNVLRLALAGEGSRNATCGARRSHEVYDLCLMCKGCKAECPSNVDVAKIKAEFLQFYYDNRPRPRSAGISSWPSCRAALNRLGAAIRPGRQLAADARGSVRWMMEKLAGIDRRRTLPPLHADHFRRWFSRHRPDALAPGEVGRVLLLADCFTTYNEPQIRHGRGLRPGARRLRSRLADVQRAAERTMISKEFLHRTKELVQAVVPALLWPRGWPTARRCSAWSQAAC